MNKNDIPKNKYQRIKDGIEQLILTLKEFPGITDVKKIKIDKYGFSRTIQFKTLEEYYEIVWFKNVMTLVKGNIQIKFNNIDTSNTWPTKHAALQFEDNNGECIAIINTELKYE